MTIKAIAAQVNAVLSVDNPMAKKAIPRRRNALDVLRLFCFMESFPFIVPKVFAERAECVLAAFGRFSYFGLTSAYGLVLSNKSVGMPFKVISKKESRKSLTITVTRFPLMGPLRPSWGARGESRGRSEKS